MPFLPNECFENCYVSPNRPSQVVSSSNKYVNCQNQHIVRKTAGIKNRSWHAFSGPSGQMAYFLRIFFSLDFNFFSRTNSGRNLFLASLLFRLLKVGRIFGFGLVYFCSMINKIPQNKQLTETFSQKVAFRFSFVQ